MRQPTMYSEEVLKTVVKRSLFMEFIEEDRVYDGTVF